MRLVLLAFALGVLALQQQAVERGMRFAFAVERALTPEAVVAPLRGELVPLD